jgi:hypothetical protein
MALWSRLMGELELPSGPQPIPFQPATSESILEPPVRSALPKLSASDPAALLDVKAAAAASSSSETSDAGAPSAEPDFPELLLDEVAAEDSTEISLDTLDSIDPETVDFELDESIEAKPDPSVEPNPAPVNPPTEAVMPGAQQLSKFRNAPVASSSKSAASEVDETSSKGPSELGRIPLVRVRREGPKRVPFLSRLLSSF